MRGALATTRDVGRPLLPRAVNVVLGAWLVASAFLLPHGDDAAFNDFICGLLVAATALQAFWAPALRWANTGLAAWIGIGALMVRYPTPVTKVHDLAIAGVILIASLAPGRMPRGQATA